MPIVKEFWCPAHGEFENDTGICPRGCSVAQREFRTPVGISTGGRTRAIDKTLESIAQSYGLSDMNNHGGTTAARIPAQSAKKMQQFQEAVRAKYPRLWGGVPSGGTYEVGVGVRGGGSGQGAEGAIMQNGGSPGDMSAIEFAKEAPRREVRAIRDPDHAAHMAKIKAA
jgi:hypothetical protein